MPDPQANPSPLAEASPESLDELFSRDPLKLQTADLTRIIETLRTQRQRWRDAELSGATRAPRAAKSATPPAPKTKLTPGATLADLGLE